MQCKIEQPPRLKVGQYIQELDTKGKKEYQKEREKNK